MKKAWCSGFAIKFPLKLFLFHVIPFCFYFTTTENSQFLGIWRPHSSIRLISTVAAWNGAFWQSCVLNIKKLDNSRKILEGNTKIPIKVDLFWPVSNGIKNRKNYWIFAPTKHAQHKN